MTNPNDILYNQILDQQELYSSPSFKWGKKLPDKIKCEKITLKKLFLDK